MWDLGEKGRNFSTWAVRGQGGAGMRRGAPGIPFAPHRSRLSSWEADEVQLSC